MGDDEKWADMAFNDDSLVALTLLRLRRHYLDHPPPLFAAPSFQVKWAVKRRRSTLATRPTAAKRKKPPPPPRKSPTTRLSWSNASSINGSTVIVCDEESSRRIDASGSKVGDQIELAAGKRSKRKRNNNQSDTATTKRARREKISAEPREDNMLLNQKRHNENKLPSLRLVFEKNPAMNGSFKRLKVNWVPRQTSNPAQELPCSVSTQTVNDTTTTFILAT